MIPEVEHSEGIRPAFPFKPASWLPVQFKDKYDDDFFVIMPGKILALDPDGRVIPAQYDGTVATTLTYSTNDVITGTIDIRTGVAVTGTATVTLSQVDGTTYGFMGRLGKAFACSKPIGIAPYAYYQWSGDASSYDDGWNPVGYKFNNYNRQHQVAVLCDACIKLPLIPGQVATEALTANWTNSTITFGTASVQKRANVILTGRYAATGSNPVTVNDTVIAIALENTSVAKNTTRTPITSTVTGMLTTEVSSIAAVNAPGYFYVDREVGVVFVYSADGQTLPAVGGKTITYFHYATAPGVYSAFACVLSSSSELVPGDLVGIGAGSNFVKITEGASTLPSSIMGQVLGFERHPMDALDMVKTAFNPALGTDATGSMSNATAGSSSVNTGQMDQMPGSANGGYPDALHYAGGSDTMVVINLIGR
jgi:hypothetical protein